MYLVRLVKVSLGRLNFGSDIPMRLVDELFKWQAGVEVVHAPLRGAAPALQDILAGQIDYCFDPATGFQHMRDGRMRGP